MSPGRLRSLLPAWKNAILAVISAVLLILAFPDFELWLLAWVGLVPLLLGIENERDSLAGSFTLGWLFGFIFFTGTCWWLTFAPITYAGFPWPLAYFLLLCVTAVVALFTGAFAALLSILLRRLGPVAILAAPFVWVAADFARYWLTGNDWNAIGYSQAFVGGLIHTAAAGGHHLIGFLLVLANAIVAFRLMQPNNRSLPARVLAYGVGVLVVVSFFNWFRSGSEQPLPEKPAVAEVVAIQPNVPMSGLTPEKWQRLRDTHVVLAEAALIAGREGTTPIDGVSPPATVIFPESPMNFAWEEDLEFRKFVGEFAARNKVNVLFNSAEPDQETRKYYNSAVLVDPLGREIAQYDKIYLVPFGESVPAPLQSIVPAFVGSFSYGKEYDLLPLGDARAGVMICFESHFGELSREYVRRGADVIVEMTNDGYLGPTPVLRQHLANAVFRAVETNRPVLRVTNVGITAYITERGEVLDASDPYTETTRVWSVVRSDGSQTLYVRWGDWFAWLCLLVTLAFTVFATMRRSPLSEGSGEVK